METAGDTAHALVTAAAPAKRNKATRHARAKPSAARA
jgi:hypothetical protein